MNIVIADDHALFRKGIRQLVAQEFPDAGVTEAGSLDEMMSLMALEAEPDLMVLDLNMPGVESADTIAAVIELFPRSKVVIVSASEGRREVGAAFAAGVNGYIPKSLQAEEIIAAIREVMHGGTFVPVAVTRRVALAEQELRKDQVSIERLNLTDRQRHVLDELLLGKSAKEIGRALDISGSTVKIHLAALYRILGVRGRAEVFERFAPARLTPPLAGSARPL